MTVGKFGYSAVVFFRKIYFIGKIRNQLAEEVETRLRVFIFVVYVA